MRLTTFFVLLSLSVQAQFKWSFEDRDFNLGDTVPVRVYVSGFDSIGAFQYSFSYDTNALSIRLDTPFTFTGLIPWTSDEFAHGLQSGLSPFFYYPKNHIKTVWADPDTFSYPNGHAYTVWFTARKTGSVCESIQMLNGPLDMPVECWHQDLIHQVEMVVDCIETRKPRVNLPEQELDYRVYPNPSSDVVHVDSTEPVQVVVVNSVGEIIYSGTVYSSDQSIPLEQGINLVRVVTSNRTITRQVIKL